MLVTDYVKFFVFLCIVSVLSVAIKTFWDVVVVLLIAGIAIYHLLKESEIL
jgi:predicted PurR-regulated permease PerM